MIRGLETNRGPQFVIIVEFPRIVGRCESGEPRLSSIGARLGSRLGFRVRVGVWVGSTYARTFTPDVLRVARCEEGS